MTKFGEDGPAIYIAGKVRQNCFRHRLVRGLRNHEGTQNLIADGFVYTGPFFTSCDHGCCHGSSMHGNGSRGCTETDGRLYTFNNCLAGVMRADMVFAYIESPDCYGTLFELGVAYLSGKPTILVFSPEMDGIERDFWFPAIKAKEVHLNVPISGLPKILTRAIDRLEGGEYGLFL